MNSYAIADSVFVIIVIPLEKILDRIDEAVDRAIANTEHLLSTKSERYRTVRLGLERMRARLARDAPGHPALERLDDYLVRLNKRIFEDDQP